MSEALVKRFSLTPTTLSEAMEYAKLMAGSSLVPAQFRDKPGDVLIAVQYGAELGVSPIQALQGIVVINGRACVWGDLGVAIVEASGELEYMRPTWDASNELATVRIKRRGKPEHTESFGMADARRAKLDAKDPYKQYPQRMCEWRAKWWAMRHEFADVLHGLQGREEVEDYPEPGPAPTVTMPRRIGETPVPSQSVASPAAASATVPPAKAEPAEHLWQGAIKDVQVESGTTNNKAWTRYDVKGMDGETFGTFSTTTAAEARTFCDKAEEVEISWKETKKGNKSIVSIRASARDEDVFA